jgi:hypothetical protein
MSRCRGCGAEIIWIKTAGGRTMCQECAGHCAQLTRERKAHAGGSV